MKRLLMALMGILIAGNVYAASSCTQTIIGNGPYHVYQMVWLTDSSGNFAATSTTQNIDGVVLLVEAVPSATAAPTDNYDVTLRNSQGIDVMGDTGAAGSEAYDGALANLDTAVGSETQPLLRGNYGAVPVMGPLTLDVFNAGNSKGGTIRVHFLAIK